MKKTMMPIMLMAAMTMMTMTTACSSDDPLSNDSTNIFGNDDNDNSGNSSGGSSTGGSSTGTYSEMSTFTIAIDKTTAEPTSTATAQYLRKATLSATRLSGRLSISTCQVPLTQEWRA